MSLPLSWLIDIDPLHSSDVLEDMRVNVQAEGSERVVWYKASVAATRMRDRAVKLTSHL